MKTSRILVWTALSAGMGISIFLQLSLVTTSSLQKTVDIIAPISSVLLTPIAMLAASAITILGVSYNNSRMAIADREQRVFDTNVRLLQDISQALITLDTRLIFFLKQKMLVNDWTPGRVAMQEAHAKTIEVMSRSAIFLEPKFREPLTSWQRNSTVLHDALCRSTIQEFAQNTELHKKIVDSNSELQRVLETLRTVCFPDDGDEA